MIHLKLALALTSIALQSLLIKTASFIFTVSSNSYNLYRRSARSKSSLQSSFSSPSPPQPPSQCTLKIAIDSTLSSGFPSTTPKTSFRFTSPSSLDLCHRLRLNATHVLVGVGTVLSDDCELNVRRGYENDGGFKGQPVRVVIDSGLKIMRGVNGGGWKILIGNDDGEMKDDGRDRLETIVYYMSTPATEALIEEFRDKQKSKHNVRVNVTFRKLPPQSKSADIPKFIVADLLTLHNSSKNSRPLHVMVEGGPKTASTFLTSNIITHGILIKVDKNVFGLDGSGDSKVDDVILNMNGLMMVGGYECGGDKVECFSKDWMWPVDVGEKIECWP